MLISTPDDRSRRSFAQPAGVNHAFHARRQHPTPPFPSGNAGIAPSAAKMNLLSDTSNIPLHCKICSRKDDFSDVSHLLTHVSSKGHLSNYYKMKVRGSNNPHDRRVVEEYDRWYEEFGLDELMSERLQQKDKKNAGGSRYAAATNSRKASGGQSRRSTLRNAATADERPGPATTASGRSTPTAMLNGRRTTRQLRDSVLNPQLGRGFKHEPKSRSATPASVLSLDPAALQNHAAFMQLPPLQPPWPPVSPYHDTPMKHESLDSSYSNDSFDLDYEDSEPMTRTRRRGGMPSESNGSYYTEEDVEIGETTSEATKLKGLIWPGMAIFDSATPEMKRKRNQKKDYSVIEHLMATSEYVEPSEMIFDSNNFFRFRRERVITGNPDLEEDEEPLSGEVTPEPDPMPAKRRAPVRRPRPALRDREVNTGRVLRRRRGSHHPPFGNSRGPYYDGNAEDEDDDLTYGQPKPKKPMGLRIHRDNTGPDITLPEAAPLSNSFLASSFRNPFQPVPDQVQPERSSQSQGYGRPHQRLPSFQYANHMAGSTFRPSAANTTTQTQNFASFGQLNSNSFFHNNMYNSSATQNGTTALTAFQQHMNAAPHHSFGHDHHPGMYHMPNSNNSNLLSWDVFAFSPQEAGFSQNMDQVLNPGTELNPLFFSSNQNTPRREDDEATISAPASEH